MKLGNLELVMKDSYSVSSSVYGEYYHKTDGNQLTEFRKIQGGAVNRRIIYEIDEDITNMDSGKSVYNIADFGSAGGDRLHIILSQLDPAYLKKIRAQCIDVSPEMVKLARKNRINDKPLYYSSKVGDVRSPHMDSGSKDAVLTLFWVLSHLQDGQEDAIKNAARILDDGGLYVFDVAGRGILAEDDPIPELWSNKWSDIYAEHLIELGKITKEDYDPETMMIYPRDELFDKDKGMDQAFCFLKAFSIDDLRSMVSKYFSDAKFLMWNWGQGDFTEAYDTEPADRGKAAHNLMVIARK